MKFCVGLLWYLKLNETWHSRVNLGDIFLLSNLAWFRQHFVTLGCKKVVIALHLARLIWAAVQALSKQLPRKFPSKSTNFSFGRIADIFAFCAELFLDANLTFEKILRCLLLLIVLKLKRRKSIFIFFHCEATNNSTSWNSFDNICLIIKILMRITNSSRSHESFDGFR